MDHVMLEKPFSEPASSISNNTEANLAACTEDAFLRLCEVEEKVGLKHSYIYAQIRQRAFPEPVKFGSASRWSRREINAWMQARLKSRSLASADAA